MRTTSWAVLATKACGTFGMVPPTINFDKPWFADRAGIDMCTNCSEGSHVYA